MKEKIFNKKDSVFVGDFKKDLLLIDLEMTGLDVNRHEIIQIAAILLDKKTIKEKEVFSSYIRPKAWQKRDRDSMAVNQIIWEQLQPAPNLKTVLKQFNKIFEPQKVILAYYGGPADMDFLRIAYKKAKVSWEFNYHYFNLWAVFYAFMASINSLNASKEFAGFNLEYLMKKFNIKSKNRHDALEDCRIEAEVLRKVLAKIK